MEHVINVLARLSAAPPKQNAATTLQRDIAPLANTKRYNRLHTKASDGQDAVPLIWDRNSLISRVVAYRSRRADLPTLPSRHWHFTIEDLVPPVRRWVSFKPSVRLIFQATINVLTGPPTPPPRAVFPVRRCHISTARDWQESASPDCCIESSRHCGRNKSQSVLRILKKRVVTRIIAVTFISRIGVVLILFNQHYQAIVNCD